MAASHNAGKVVSIREFGTVRCNQPPLITQARLRLGNRLLEEQRRILESLQRFKMDMDNELAAGAEIEAGELTFDRDLKIVRPRRVTPAKVLQVSAR